MSARFEELDWRQTPIGVISLRRRRDPALGIDVYEAKLDDDYLMSSLYTAAEIELARLGLAAVSAPGQLDVVVGGLGLGYTAQAALADPRVRELVVVEALEEVIGWHRRQLLPATADLTGDPRTELVHADFHSLFADDPEPSGSPIAGRRFDAVLVDIDHSPRNLLDPVNARLYEVAGLHVLAERLRPGGVFALWSDDPPDAEFGRALAVVFAEWEAHVVRFANPYDASESANTVYVASRPSAATPTDGST